MTNCTPLRPNYAMKGLIKKSNKENDDGQHMFEMIVSDLGQRIKGGSCFYSSGIGSMGHFC